MPSQALNYRKWRPKILRLLVRHGRQEDLEALLGTAVDLVEPGPIRNPYFRDAVEASRVLLFEAA